MVKKNMLEISKNEKIESISTEKLDENMDLIFILDRSGSMHGSEQDIINGFNSFIEKQTVKYPK